MGIYISWAVGGLLKRSTSWTWSTCTFFGATREPLLWISNTDDDDGVGKFWGIKMIISRQRRRIRIKRVELWSTKVFSCLNVRSKECKFQPQIKSSPFHFLVLLWGLNIGIVDQWWLIFMYKKEYKNLFHRRTFINLRTLYIAWRRFYYFSELFLAIFEVHKSLLIDLNVLNVFTT